MGHINNFAEALGRLGPSEGAARRVKAVAVFEIGRQMRHPGFWIATGLLFGAALLIMSTDKLMGSGVLARNAPAELAKATVILTIFFVFGAVALAADAALRDSVSGFAPILRATPQTRAENIIGRVLGLQAAAITCFTLAASGLVVGAVMPWVDQKATGPFLWPQIALVWLIMGVPTVIALTSGCFALAAALRSAVAAYIVVIVALLLVIALPSMSRKLSQQWLVAAAMIEPFGLVGFTKDTIFWPVARKAAQGVPFGGLLMLNRAGVLLSSGLTVVTAMWAERRVDETRLRRAPPSAKPDALFAPAHRRSARPTFGIRTALLQFVVRLRTEVKAIVLRPSLLILTALILMFAVANLWTANKFNGTPSLPATRVLAGALRPWFTMLALLVAAFYAGEAVWRERDRKVADLIDATPTADVIFLATKVIAVLCAILVLGCACVAAAVGVQLAKGYFEPNPGQYLTLLIVPVLQDVAFLTMLSITAAALSPHRFVGWLASALAIGASITASIMGFSHPLFDFAAIPSAPLSEMNPQGYGGQARAWISLYWLLWCGLAAVVMWLFWPRGQRASIKAGLVRARILLRGPGGWIAGGLLTLTVAVGGWIFVNTVIWNPFVPTRAREARAARFERDMAPLLRAPEPVVIDTRLRVSLSPRAPRLEATGRLMLENRTGAPLSRFHVDLPAGLSEVKVAVEGAHQISNHDGLLTFDMRRPLAVGERTPLTFHSLFAPHGFSADGGQTSVTSNGAFVRSDVFTPTIGVNPGAFLRDPAVRRRLKLPEALPTLEPGDPRAGNRNYIRADWTTTDITVITDADQTPMAPGRQIVDAVADGRRTARFVSDAPILGWFSIQSARYEVRRIRRGDVDIAIYFHPGHGRNVDRMLAALKGGLEIYEREFGPYQFSYLRVVEFPAYGDYAQAFAGTIPFSENAGFITDLRDPKAFDYVTNITLHELAHQWWAHQVIGGDARGARLMSEGLADYSATMAQGRLQGLGAANEALSQSQSAYNEGRASRRDAEPALIRENGERYVTYARANMAFAIAREVMGEAALHRALRGFLREYAARGAPYPTSADLMARLQAETTAERWKRLEPLFAETGVIGSPLYLDAALTGEPQPKVFNADPVGSTAAPKKPMRGAPRGSDPPAVRKGVERNRQRQCVNAGC
ncbi:MAG: hypothetical protein KKC14_17780 [Alphaproteobacteria bacterium]|nr:hypothetical protein [Alphaproteobacteria bacterium]